MRPTYAVFSDLAEHILFDGAVKATKYVSEKETVKATRRLYGGKIDKRFKAVEILFTIGPPNYAERQWIKVAKKAGEPFPVKKIQLAWPKEKKA